MQRDLLEGEKKTCVCNITMKGHILVEILCAYLEQSRTIQTPHWPILCVNPISDRWGSVISSSHLMLNYLSSSSARNVLTISRVMTHQMIK